MKLNNKGITLVEIIISIVLVSIVLIFLFSLLVSVKDLNSESEVNSTYLINKSLILKNIEEDLDTATSVTVGKCTVGEDFYEPYSSYVDTLTDEKFKASECLQLDYGDKGTGYLAIYYYLNKKSYVISYIHGDKRATRLLPEFIKYNILENDIKNKMTLTISDINENKPISYDSIESTQINLNNFMKIEIPIIGSDEKDYTISVSYYKDEKEIEKDLIARFGEGTLAYNILNNTQNNTNGTTFVNASSLGEIGNTTKPGQKVSSANEKILSTTEDDSGISYYFRGNVEDNYANFAGMCWRIVCFKGDGSIKLILASEKTCSTSNLTDNSGYATDGVAGSLGTIIQADYGLKKDGSKKINDYINSASSTDNARTKLNEWLERKITKASDIALLKNEKWCIGDQKNGYNSSGNVVGTISDLISTGAGFNFSANNKRDVTEVPSYKCETTGANGEVDINKVGMLTFDEVVYAGGGGGNNYNYYLYNNAKNNEWWLLSPSFYDHYNTTVHSYYVTTGGGLHGSAVFTKNALRPVVSLESDEKIFSGDGTIDNPYVIN